MATDVYRAPEMRHGAGERHHSIWEGSGGAECHSGRAGVGAAGRGGVLLPLPKTPAWLKGPGLLPARGGLDLYRGFCLSPAGESSWEPGSGVTGLFAVIWGLLALALPRSISPEYISASPRAPRSCLGCSWGRSQQFYHGAGQPGPSCLQVCCPGGISQFWPQPQSTEGQAGWC